MIPTAAYSMGTVHGAMRARLDDWEEDEYGHRIWAHDPTLWGDEDTPELTDRLGWLSLPTEMTSMVDELREFTDEVRKDIDHVVLLGMGGSSLAPEVYQATFGNAEGHPELIVLDSTHPGAVDAVHARIDPIRTLFLVSSKSGGTLETLSFFRYFWAVMDERVRKPGRHFVALTDPGSKLEAMAKKRKFRRVFSTPPTVGGRYSALTLFGLVPAALIGVDIEALLASAARMADACGPDVDAHHNPGLQLGAAIGEAARAGRDKLTYVVSPALSAFPAWAEQLVAESTGKDNKGIVPVAGEPIGEHRVYGDDRVFIHMMVAGDDPIGQPAALEVLQAAGHPIIRIVLDELTDLGAEFFRAELAVAAAGSVLGIHPFNQPDVQVAKDLAEQAMSEEGLDADVEEVDASDREALAAAWRAWIGELRQGDYVSVHAYLPRRGRAAALLDQFQADLRDRLKVPVTLGYGPRFLHSTGQLHKGGANNGVFLQIVDDPGLGLGVPETDYTFDELIAGQANGDYQALHERDRRVLRVTVGDQPAAGLAAIVGVASV